jgi:FkbM family methyltransferase
MAFPELAKPLPVPALTEQGRPTPLRTKLTVSAILAMARWTPYFEAEMLGLASLIEPGSVCIDVGSAAGLYTLALSRLAGPTGEVHSVEPLSFAHRACRNLLQADDAPNVRRHQVALGAKPGNEVMSVPVGRFGLVTGRSFLSRKATSLGANTEFQEHVDVVVDVDTLDQLCARLAIKRLDFLKIDVEGAELDVLEGGRAVIAEFGPTMLVEIEARHTSRFRYQPEDLVSWFVRRGYAMHVWDRRAWRVVDQVCVHVRNYLFRPPPSGRRRALSARPTAA